LQNYLEGRQKIRPENENLCPIDIPGNLFFALLLSMHANLIFAKRLGKEILLAK